MSRRSATAPLSLGRLMPPEPPATADRTARQIPGYLLFLANWANVVGLVPRRLAGGSGERGPSGPSWRGDLANGDLTGLAGGGPGGPSWRAGGSYGRVKRSTSPPHASAYLPFAKNATAMPLGPACVPIVAPMETVGNSST